MFIADRSNARLRRRRGRTVVRALASSPAITVLTAPSQNIANLRPGLTIGGAWVPGVYVSPTGACAEGVPSYRVNGATKSAAYVLVAGDVVQMASVSVTAPGGLTLLVGADPAPFASFTVPAEWRGYQPAMDFGTAGDIYVAPTGSDTNPGTLAAPKLSIQAAILANPSKQIRLRGGIYRQEVILNTGASGTAGAFTRVSRYGAEEPIISGSEVLTGLTPCVAGDAAIIGSIWNRADVFKVTLADSVVASSDPTGFFPREAGVALPMVCEFVPGAFAPVDPTAIEDWPTWTVLKAGDVPAATGDAITGYQNTAITDKYTQAEIQAMSLYQYGGANLTNPNGIASFDTAAKIIRLTGTGVTKSGSAYGDRMLLQNIPKGLKQGYWAYKKNGDGTTTYYLWLNNAANAVSGVEYATRVRNLNLGNASYITFEGIVFEGTASANQANPSTHHAIVQPQGGSATNQRIYNCLIRQHHRSLNRTSFGFYAWNSHYLQFRQSTISECYGMYGFHPVGQSSPGSPAAMTVGLWVDRCRFDRTASTAIRIYGQLFPTISHCLWDYDVGVSPHANLIDPKLFSHGALLIGLDLSGANGYMTFQDASAVNMLACYMHGNRITGDSRTAQDQNGTDPTQSPAGAGGAFAVLNPRGLWACNHFAPDAQDMTQQANFNLGKALNTACTFRLSHNIIFGPSTIDATAVSRDKNLIVSGAAVGTEVSEGWATTYVDAANADFRIAPGSAARSMIRTDLTADINAIKADRPWIPASVFVTDINGDTIDWTNPPIGPAVNIDVNWKGQSWLTWPTLVGGSSIVGQVLDVNDGQRHPGTLVPTYQWLRSNDGRQSWAPIAGATARTYTVAGADAGGILARDAWLGGKSKRRTVINSTVLASSPLGDPVLAFAHKTTTNALQFECATFTAENRPMIVLIAARMNPTTLANLTLTIGAPGRAAGTGTAIPGVPTNIGANRSSTAIWAYYIAAPGTGSSTVQITSDAQLNGLEVTALYVDGAVGVTRLNSNGLTAATISHSRTTTKPYSKILFVGAVNDGSRSLTLSGATLIRAEASGAATDDVSAIFGWIDAPSAAAYTASITSSVSGSIILGSVIVESS